VRTITNRENRSYELTEYDDSWASKYNEYKAMVSGLLGDNMTFIDHVGSTAVPGMLAKPIIDIAVRVKDLDAVRGKVNEFLGSGFAYHADFIGKGDEYFTLDHDA
jgi:GrpB-like predicted nucleotidyltransferase (UPF0157 family)